MEHKDAMDAHSTQRHRGTEAQKHKGRTEHRLKKSNRIARMVKINRIVVF
jgi:hypothetical protein